MLDYIYAGMWFLVGLILLLRLRKENRVFLFAGFLFLFMGVWWLANILLPELDLFGGVYAWLFRGVMAGALIVTVLAYYKQRKKDQAEQAEQEEPEEAPLPREQTEDGEGLEK